MPVAGQHGIHAQFRCRAVGEHRQQPAVGQPGVEDEIGLAGEAHAAGGGFGQDVAVAGGERAAQRHGDGAAVGRGEGPARVGGDGGVAEAGVVREVFRRGRGAVAGEVVG